MDTRKINEAIGQKIARLLAIHSMSQSELARRVGYANHTAISQMISGTKGPGKVMLKRIAEALRVPEPFLANDQVYTEEELKILIKLFDVIENKTANPETYQFVMKFFRML